MGKVRKMALPGPGRVSAFGGRGTSFSGLEQHVHLWRRKTKTEAASRASLLVLHMRSAPRQVRLATGGGHSDNHDDVARILRILRNYFAPEAAGAIPQQVMRFAQCRRAEQSTNEFIAEFGLSQAKAGPKMGERASPKGGSATQIINGGDLKSKNWSVRWSGTPPHFTKPRQQFWQSMSTS